MKRKQRHDIVFSDDEITIVQHYPEGVMHDYLKLEGKGRLTAVLPGTRKYGNPVTIKDKDGHTIFNGRPLIDPGVIVAVREAPNVITTVGKAFIGDMLIDLDGDHDTGLTYCAEGTDATTPVVGDTTLTAEAARKAITSKTRSGNEITLSTFFTAAEANDDIKEAGIFGHADATAAADSGKLLAHWLTAYDNSGAAVDIVIDYVLTIG